MSGKTAVEKARIKPGTIVAVINPVATVVNSLGLPKDVTFVKPAQAKLIFLFAKSRRTTTIAWRHCMPNGLGEIAC